MSGTTWIELFALFDISGARSEGGDHIRDPEVTRRGEKRRTKATNAKDKKKREGEHTAVVRPTLDMELKTFKVVVRQITRHETSHQQAKWFTMEGRTKLRRLAKLGITGHQPAIAAYCKVDEGERQEITEAILKQKVGNNLKAEKNHQEFKARGEGTMLVKIARIAQGTFVRWKRKKKENQVQSESNEEKEQEQQILYSSRLLNCTRCGSSQETRRMQLRTKVGYRAIHCKTCGKQECCARNTCQCGSVWHQCEVHRIDPEEHISRKGKLKERQRPKVGMRLSTRRKAPEGEDEKPLHVKHRKFVASNTPPIRIRHSEVLEEEAAGK